jgi:PQQ system protein
VSRPDPAAGVFETVRVEHGQPLCLPAHLARLRASVRALYGAEVGDELEACVSGALRAARDDAAQRLRVVVAPAAAPEASLGPLGAAASRDPVTLRPWTLAGGLGGHKWVDRRLVDEASERLRDTPMIVEPDGEVLEAAWGNLWALEGRRLTTPRADGRLLPGVTRARLLALAGDLGLEAVEAPLSLARLARVDAIVVTSALRMAVPGRLEPGRASGRDELVARIAAALRERALAEAARWRTADARTRCGDHRLDQRRPPVLGSARNPSAKERSAVSETRAVDVPGLDQQNGATLGRILGRGKVGQAEEGPDGKMHASVRIPEDELVYEPGVLVLPHGGELELELINDDKNTHCAVLPSNGDVQFIWLVNHSKGKANLILDGPGYYWYGSRTGNDEGRGLTGAIVVQGEAPEEAKLDRPPQPRP